jgi:hypothetical protein
MKSNRIELKQVQSFGMSILNAANAEAISEYSIYRDSLVKVREVGLNSLFFFLSWASEALLA